MKPSPAKDASFCPSCRNRRSNNGNTIIKIVAMCACSAAFAAMSTALLCIIIMNGGTSGGGGGRDNLLFQHGSVLPEHTLHQPEKLQYYDITDARTIITHKMSGRDEKSTTIGGKKDQGETSILLLPNKKVQLRKFSFVRGPTINSSADTTSKASTIHLIGERHSGTNWITDHLKDCFGDQIEVQPAFTRFKHWFQYNNPDIPNESAAVVAMFRDPYNWVEAMREQAHHAHDHIDLEWKEFVSKPWVRSRGPADTVVLNKAKEENRIIEYAGCLAGYKFDEVIPCSEADAVMKDGYSNLMYELMHDGSHRAYASIVDLRRDKILNFLQVPNFHGVKAFFPQRYEALKLRGTASLLAQLEEVTGLKAQCEPFKGSGAVTHKNVDPEYTKWMNKFVDWDVEGMIGYVQREPVPWKLPVPRVKGQSLKQSKNKILHQVKGQALKQSKKKVRWVTGQALKQSIVKGNRQG